MAESAVSVPAAGVGSDGVASGCMASWIASGMVATAAVGGGGSETVCSERASFMRARRRIRSCSSSGSGGSGLFNGADGVSIGDADSVCGAKEERERG